MDFVLVPDAVTANYVRGELAKQGIANTKVGNFQALIDILKELWIIPEKEDTFSQQLQSNALQMKEAFWAESILVDEIAVINLLENTVNQLLNLLPINHIPEVIADPQTRLEQYFNDIIRLFYFLNDRPSDQKTAAEWLSLDITDSIQPVNLFVLDNVRLHPWQKEVVNRLLAHSNLEQQILFTETQQQLRLQGAQDYIDMSNRLFEEASPQPVPDGFKGVLCRDLLEEFEVLASRIQKLIQQGTSPNEIAFIYPKGMDGIAYLSQEFAKREITLSNLPLIETGYDWQTELLRDLISLQLNPLVPMVKKSVLSNPLMPWAFKAKLNRILSSDKHSQAIADEYCEGLYQLVNQSVTNSEEFLVLLAEIGNKLKFQNELSLTKRRWLVLLEQVKTVFALYASLSFPEQCQKVLAQLRSASMTLNSEKPFYLNAVTALSSSESLPKPVEHLFVIGFNEGHYRFTLKDQISNTVLDLGTWQSLGFSEIMQANLLYEQQILKQNLAKTKQSLTLLASRQAFDGSSLGLSEMALDLALCFQEVEEVDPHELFSHLNELGDDFVAWKQLAVEDLRTDEIEDLTFAENLLSLHKDSDGNQRAESPSSLERMMVSPLDWLFNRQGLEDKSWQIQTLDILIQGQTAHKVFELYKDHQAKGYSDALFEELFTKSLQLEAPFVLQPGWRLERIHLKQQVKRALIGFVDWLNAEDWRIDDVEKRLHGEIWGIPLKGFTDAVLVNGDKTLILDYKKSKSDDRIKRLNNGLDLQTYIYRSLYAQQFGDSEIHSGYYTLNDQVLALDQSDSSQTTIKVKTPDVSLEEQSLEARNIIQNRLRELADGFVRLNRSTDEKSWADKGVKAYSLNDNPVIKRFVIEEEEV
jgi:hypothetical protein